MARCGCQGSGSSTCEAIVRCVAQNLGPGLVFSNGNIQVRLSRDGGNCLRFGSDEGIYSQCAALPPGEGGKTIEGLPDDVFVGTNGGAGLVQSFGSPQAIEYAVASRLDIIDCYSYALYDDTAAWGPYGGTTLVNFYTNNPTTEGGRDLTMEQWINLVSDSGVPGGNPTGRNSDAPTAQLTPDGGWYGWYQQPHRLMATTEALKQVAARTCVILQHSHEGNYDVQANASAILSIQAQDWVMPSLGTTALSSVPTYLDFGIQHVCINVGNHPTITAAEVVASGATWVKMRTDQSDARVNEFVTAGLQVIMTTDARQNTAQKYLDLGVRGIQSGDPVYQRGVLGGDWLEYQLTKMWFLTRTTEIGMLTGLTDNGAILDGVGYPKNSEYGRFFQPGWGWSGSNSRSTCAQLLGKFCPIEDPTAYRMEMQVKVDQASLPSGSQPKMGWIIAADTDIDPSFISATEPVPTTRHGYACFIRCGSSSTGELNIIVYDAVGVPTTLATAPTGAITPNTWVSLEVEVTATNITLRRTSGTIGEVTAANAAWRGPYAFHLWEDVTAGGGAQFAHGYRNNRFINTGAGGVVWDQLTALYPNWEEMAAAKPTWEELAEDTT